ncbi:MAG: hypothetical protein AAF965_08515 [Pseudomonadota bacterium]
MKVEKPDEFEAWLKTQPNEMCVLIATRAAVRVFPTLSHPSEITKDTEMLALLTARAILTSGVAAKAPTPEVSAATRAAADAATRAANLAAALAALAAALAADSAADSADAATFATRAATFAADGAGDPADAVDDAATRSAILATASAAARAATNADAGSSLDFEDLLEIQIWRDPKEPDWLVDMLRDRPNLLEREPGWAFWRDWYQGWLTGQHVDWELQRRVALVDSAIWEEGSSAVTAEIDRLRAEWLAEKLPQAEEITCDDRGIYSVSAIAVDPDAMVDKIFEQVGFSLDLALRGHNQSGFSEMCTAYQYLDHTRKKCRDDPNAVHMHFRLAREIIEGKFKSGTYLPEDALNALVIALERHEIQLRADHPVVREAHGSFVAQRLRELDEEKRLDIAGEFRALQGDTKGRLAEEFRLDAETAETSTSEEAQAEAIKRSGGRSQKMHVLERVAQGTKVVDGSAANKSIGLMMRLQKLAELLQGLF